MIGDNAHNLNRQRADFGFVDQIDQAMLGLGYGDQRAQGMAQIEDLERQSECAGGGAQDRFKIVEVSRLARDVHAGEKRAGRRVAKNTRVTDVPSGGRQRRGYGGDDTGTVFAAKPQDDVARRGRGHDWDFPGDGPNGRWRSIVVG